MEVGTTNRTHVRDFAQAITPATAAIIRVHSSNFRQIGFVTEPSLVELAAVAHGDVGKEHGGTGAPCPAANRRPGQRHLARHGCLWPGGGADGAGEPGCGRGIVTFSGDKLLGGPQAGLILGRAELIALLRRHPMARALRVDKMTLAALDATLRSYGRGRAVEEIPVWRMITRHARKRCVPRAEQWQAAPL